MVLQQHEPVRIGSPLGHVAFARANFRQARQHFGQRGSTGQGSAVAVLGLLLPDTDPSIEGRLARGERP